MKMRTRDWKAPFQNSIPVLFGYLPLGITFGVVFSTLPYPWYWATLSGLVVYAGAAQFLSVGLIAAHAGLVEIFTAVFFLNVRHVFYGFSLLKRFRGARFKPYLIFGLTDETYSVLTSTHGDSNYCLRLTALNHFYWVTGCTLGAIAGKMAHFDTRGFEFVLTALFTVLAVEQWRSLRRFPPFALGFIASMLALFIFPKQFLAVAVGFATLVLLISTQFFKEARVQK